jgi:hypothetical protein
MAAEFTVTAAVPVDVNVIDCVAAVPTFTLPKLKVEALIVSVGVLVLKIRLKVADAPPALAVSVTDCAELTDETLAVKPALEAAAGTVTEAGTVTALLLLAKPTAKPPVVAAAFSVTVQLSVPVPVIEPLAQLRLVNTGKPVPLRLIKVEVPLEELLLIVSCPVALPADAGWNCTVSVAV